MMIKFLAHGTGKASSAATYLLDSHDHKGEERAGVAVLRGDPQQFAAVADSLDFQHRYRSAVISWSEEEAPSDAEIGAVLDDFEALSFAGLDRQDVHLTAVQHREAGGGVHVHILVPRVHLGTGKSLNIAPPGHRKDFDALRDKWNYGKGWARPDDPLRARLIQPSFDAYKGQQDRTAIKRQIGDHLLGAVAQGLIRDRGELLEYLGEVLEFEITRQGKDYITIRPEGYPQGIRLKGELYGEGWRAENTLERETSAAASRGAGRGGHVDRGQSDTAQRAFDKACERRAEYNQGRYSAAERADHHVVRFTAERLGTTTGDRGRAQMLELDGLGADPKGVKRRDHSRPGEGNRAGDRSAQDGPRATQDGRGGPESGDVPGMAQTAADIDGGDPRGRGQYLGGGSVPGERDHRATDRASEPKPADQHSPTDPRQLAQRGDVRARPRWAVHRGEADRYTVQDGRRDVQGPDGRGGEVDDRIRAAADSSIRADGTTAPGRDDGLAGAARRATARFEELAGAVAEHIGRVREALRQLTHRLRGLGEEYQERASQHGPEFGPDQPGYRSSTWVIEQQCEHSQKLAGELEQGAELIVDRAAVLRKEQSQSSGLSM
ncbi:TPA: relaxase/mobilization nuclease domain-containing protein [Aeromonas hydrophila]|nr:relaxase/mobilization nuclease domain-containing protein [Aeromonas hydrophila]HDO1340919.1 relaxase/mobilization nuclease domain-containing protein [Aeromonas veronii]HDT5890563.1 relaxase/mobilization nuclease domain-containing protein [Aeromonas dhakensis]HEB4981178.1 relaxase/mobilization nuclease domain-containing protein [Aeromonas dhakensis]